MNGLKSEDKKIEIVKYYLNYRTSLEETCTQYKCLETSLKRWINRYLKENCIKNIHINGRLIRLLKNM